MDGSGLLENVVDGGILRRPIGNRTLLPLVVKWARRGLLAHRSLDGLGRPGPLTHGCEGGSALMGLIGRVCNYETWWAV